MTGASFWKSKETKQGLLTHLSPTIFGVGFSTFLDLRQEVAKVSQGHTLHLS